MSILLLRLHVTCYVNLAEMRLLFTGLELGTHILRMDTYIEDTE